jgi:hypothetical protein
MKKNSNFVHECSFLPNLFIFNCSFLVYVSILTKFPLILIYSLFFFLWKVNFSKNGRTLSNAPNHKEAILKSLPADIMKKMSNFYENAEFIDGTLRKWFEAAIASIGCNEILRIKNRNPRCFLFLIFDKQINHFFILSTIFFASKKAKIIYQSDQFLSKFHLTV